MSDVIFFFIFFYSHDYGGYKRTRQSSQVAEVPTTLQPDRTIEQTPIIHSENVVQQTSRDTGSNSELDTWSFDRAISEVFRLGTSIGVMP